MEYIKKHRNKIIAAAVAAVVLAFTFWWGGNSPGLHGWHTDKPEEKVSAAAKPKKAKTTAEPKQASEQAEQTPKPTEKAGREKPKSKDSAPMTANEKIELAEQIAEEQGITVEAPAEPVVNETPEEEYNETVYFGESSGNNTKPTEHPAPIDPKSAVISDKELNCTLTVKCDTIYNNSSWLDKEKLELIPQGGIIFPEQAVVFYEGESVFNLLLREMKKHKIHLEYTSTPIYNSAYIEGINNIYETDCGELSGWMYKVNDWFPPYGCSRYKLSAGDKVEIVYTCDLGIDVGGYYAPRNGFSRSECPDD